MFAIVVDSSTGQQPLVSLISFVIHFSGCCCGFVCKSATTSGFAMSATPVPFVCPWTCLVSPSPKPSVVASMVANHNFAQALLNKVDVSVSDLPKPCLKGDSLSIKILEHVYQSGMSNCSNYLHGRLVFARGDKPFSSKDLREKLLRLWKPIC